MASRAVRRSAGCVSWSFMVLLLAVSPCIPNLAHADGAGRVTAFKALVDRQVRAWMTSDFAIAADDWAADGELRSPGGSAKKSELQASIKDYFAHFKDLSVVVHQVFLSADGKSGAIEWDWNVTRIRDGVRGLTHDAIIVDLENGKIKSWREYFDLGNSVDSKP